MKNSDNFIIWFLVFIPLAYAYYLLLGFPGLIAGFTMALILATILSSNKEEKKETKV